MTRRTNRRRRLGFESLEKKMMLSADVGVEVVAGDLVVWASRADDRITMTRETEAGSWIVDPGPEGSINGGRTGESATFDGVTDDVRVYLRRGNDELSIRGRLGGMYQTYENDIEGSLIVKGSHQGNVIQAYNLRVGEDAIVRTREGSDRVEIHQVQTGGDMVIKTARGDDTVLVRGMELGVWGPFGSKVGGDLIVHAGGGWYDDRVEVFRAVVEDDLLIRSTRGNNAYSLDQSIEVGGRTRLFGGEGDDSIQVGAFPLVVPIDYPILFDAQGTVPVASTRDDTSDPDLFVIQTRQLQIHTFGGADDVRMTHANVGRHMRVFLGEGDDSMTVENSRVGGNSIISGAGGDDYLRLGYTQTNDLPNDFQGTTWFDGGEGADDTLRYKAEDQLGQREWTNWETVEEMAPWVGLWPPALVNDSVSDSVNAFGLDLYEEIQDTEGNLFFSPLSISTALAMVYAGARGDTAEQMADVLYFQQDPDALGVAFGELLDDLNTAGEEGDFELSIANALWGQEGFPLREDYLDLILANYDGGLQEVDFKTDAEAARQTINGWVEEQTHDKILDLIPQGILNEYTRLVLTNAIYFQSEWANQFNPDFTHAGSFTPESGEPVEVSMMHETAGYRYMEQDGFQVLELPYEGGRQSMVILLPIQDTEEFNLDALDAQRIPDDLGDWLTGLERQSVSVTLPQFEITEALKLKDVLQSMGMVDLFENYADLSGIGPELKVDDVLHKAFVEVDEAGTTAAAATAVVVVEITSLFPGPPPVSFVADHPFHFLIRDNVSETVLFMGRVSNPGDGSEGSE